jgi:hypothetical protein
LRFRPGRHRRERHGKQKSGQEKPDKLVGSDLHFNSIIPFSPGAGSILLLPSRTFLLTVKNSEV